MKTINNRLDDTLSDPNSAISGLDAVQTVRVINDWPDDYGRTLVTGRSSGFTAGY